MKKQSSFETFCEWLDECCQEASLYIMEMPPNYILSWAGSDGPDIKGEKMDGIPFSRPDKIDKLLKDEGYYKNTPASPYFGPRKAPKVHYLDWFNKKYNNEKS